MIYLKKLKLKDFVSHKESEIDFRHNNSKISITGKSGSGKSSIVQAILFALYGDAKVDNASLIRKGAKSAQISLTILVDDKEYIIDKSITKTGQKMSLHCNDEDITQATNKETQKYLEDNILKTSLTLFKNSVFAMQNDSSLFVHETPAKRKDVLMEIVDTYNFEELYNKTKEKIDECKTQETVLNSDIVQLSGVLNTTDEVVEDINVLKSQQKEYTLSINGTEKVIESSHAMKSDLTTTIGTLKFKDKTREDYVSQQELLIKKGNELKMKIDTYNSLSSEDIKAKLQSIEKRLGELQVSRDQYNTYTINYNTWQRVKMDHLSIKPNIMNYDIKIQELRERYNKTKGSPDLFCVEIGKICPKLQQKLDKDLELITQEAKHLQDMKKMQDDLVEQWNKKLSDIEQQMPTSITLDYKVIEAEYKELLNQKNTLIEQSQILTSLSLWKDQKEALLAQYNSLKEKIDVLGSEISTLPELEEQLRALNEQIIELQSHLKDEKNILNDILVKITKIEQQDKLKAEIGDKIENKKQEILDMQDNIQALETLKIAFGNNGIRTLILDDVLPTLELSTNEILSELSDFRIKFDTQKESSKGDKVVEGLFITIINDQGEELDFNSYSGGEQNKIIVSIQQALAKFSHFGFMIQDELISGLDSESIDNFSKIMLNLKEKSMQVVSISHIPEIKDLFDDQITVEKKNGISCVKVVD